MVFKPYITKRTAEATLRETIFARLNESIYDANGNAVPVFNGSAKPSEPYPYIVIGEPIDGPDAGTKTTDGDDRTIIMHAYTQEDGYTLVNSLKDQVLAALRLPLDLTDPTWHLYYVDLSAGGRTMRISDLYAHAAFNIRFKLQSLLN